MHYYHMSPGCQQQAVEGHLPSRASAFLCVRLTRMALHDPPACAAELRLPASREFQAITAVSSCMRRESQRLSALPKAVAYDDKSAGATS